VDQLALLVVFQEVLVVVVVELALKEMVVLDPLVLMVITQGCPPLVVAELIMVGLAAGAGELLQQQDRLVLLVVQAVQVVLVHYVLAGGSNLRMEYNQ
jgi:hypothetical protein